MDRLRSPLSTLPDGIMSRLFRNAHHHGLTTATCGGLRSTPDCRTRRVLLHLSYSCASPFGPALLVTQDPKRSSMPSSAALFDRLMGAQERKAVPARFGRAPFPLLD